MDSDIQQQQYQHHFQDLQRQFHHQKQQVNNLTRFRSAPSSYFASFLDAADSVTNTSGVNEGGNRSDFPNTRRDFSNARPLSPETENIFSRFMYKMGAENNSSSVAQPESAVRVKRESDTMLQQPQQLQQQKLLQPQHQLLQPQPQGNFNTSSQMIYHSPSKPPLANQHSSGSAVSSAMGKQFRGVSGSSTGMGAPPQMKIGIGGSNNNNNSSLTRHSSSPAGFFANLDIDVYGVIRDVGNYGGGNNSNDQINFSSTQPSATSGLMRQNSGAAGKIMRMSSIEESKFSNPNNTPNNDSKYIDDFPMTSWDDSILSDNFSPLDKGDDSGKTFTELQAQDSQGGEDRNRPPLLAHHLSLPKTSAEIAAMENLMQFQDSVPCRIRAKRGCATHPRSIAERVRRTKISERMRKLQDLVPNMDKQTNTADMLDLAVDYIKELQKQVKVLDDNRAKCTCSR